MSIEEQRALHEKTYGALGQYVVAFAGLQFAMEMATIQLFPAPENTELLHIVLAGRTADPITKTFFAAFHAKWRDVLSEQDLKITTALRKEIGERITERNRLLHDAWLMSHTDAGQEPTPLVSLRIRQHGKGAEFVGESYTPERLLAIVVELRRLHSLVSACAFYLNPTVVGPNLSVRMEVVGGKVQLREKDA